MRVFEVATRDSRYGATCEALIDPQVARSNEHSAPMCQPGHSESAARLIALGFVWPQTSNGGTRDAGVLNPSALLEPS